MEDRMQLCRICKGFIDMEEQPSFSYESVKDTFNRNYYHQKCLFKVTAMNFEKELEEEK